MRYNDLVEDSHRAILYNNTYGGYKLNKEGFKRIYEKFPEKREIYGWDKEDIYDSFRYDFVRDDQDIIKFMLDSENGLKDFGTLEIEIIHKDMHYTIDDYDGKEMITPKLPTNDIMEDLINYIKHLKKDEVIFNNKFKSNITKELLRTMDMKSLNLYYN